MKVTLNDIAVDAADGTTVAALLEGQNIKTRGIALAVNGKVLPKADYESHCLSDGDSIIIIKAFYGG